MAGRAPSEAEHLRTKARRDLLDLLEGVSKAAIFCPDVILTMPRSGEGRTWSSAVN